MSDRLTITIIRRRVEKGINPHLAEKDQINVIGLNGGWNIENAKGNRITGASKGEGFSRGLHGRSRRLYRE